MYQPHDLPNEVDHFVSETWAAAETFIRLSGMGPSMFGRHAVNDPNLIRHVRDGRRRLTFTMAQRLRRFLDTQGEQATS